MIERSTELQLEALTKESLEEITLRRDSLVDELDIKKGLSDKERQKIGRQVDELDTTEELLQCILGETEEEGNNWARKLGKISVENDIPMELLKKELLLRLVSPADDISSIPKPKLSLRNYIGLIFD